jgi:hypothetical protein
MKTCARLVALCIALGAASLPGAVRAGVPFPPNCSCTISIVQFATRTGCIANNEPDVVRLTPAGSTATPIADRLLVTARLRDADGAPAVGYEVRFCEQSETVNIATTGATAATSNAEGLASVVLHGASGYGLVALTAGDDDTPLCRWEIRSADTAGGFTPSLCALPTTGSSFVNGAEVINPVCGIIANFGPVTPGVNNGWDFDCTGSVAGADITGGIGKGGILLYFGDGAALGERLGCTP